MVRDEVREQAGMATLLTAVVLLPLVVVMLKLGLELAGLFSGMRGLETQLDRLAMDSAQRLPDEEVALSIARRGLDTIVAQSSVLEELRPKAHILGERIILELKGSYRPLPVFNAGITEFLFPVSLRVEGARAPGVATILLDMSGHLGPSNEGEVVESRPSNYFLSLYGDNSLAKLRTQRCINPNTAAIKRAAIALHGWFSLDSRHPPLIGSFPGFAASFGEYEEVHWLDSPDQFGFRGVLASDLSCRRQAEFEGAESVFSTPAGFAMGSNVKEAVWGKVLQEENASFGQVGGAMTAAFSRMSLREDRLSYGLHKLLVVVAGDVPELSSLGNSHYELAEFLVNAGLRGGSSRIHYLVFQDSVLRDRSPGASQRLSHLVGKMSDAFRSFGARAQKIEFSGQYFNDQAKFYAETRRLMRRGVGPAVVRRAL